jgi:hypothetical protein
MKTLGKYRFNSTGIVNLDTGRLVPSVLKDGEIQYALYIEGARVVKTLKDWISLAQVGVGGDKKYAPREKNCTVCGKVFTARHGKAKYCPTHQVEVRRKQMRDSWNKKEVL